MLNEKGGFVRPCLVSTDEQAMKGLSLQAQKEALTEYAKLHKYEIVDYYADEGVSAHQPYKKRPELMRLLRDVEKGEIDLILFIKIDRWFRSVEQYYEVQKILDEYKVDWNAIFEDYNTNTSEGKLRINIMLSVAQAESERTSERIKFVFDNKKQKGEYTGGRLPLGYKLVNKRLVVDEEEAQLVRDIFNKYLDLRSVHGVSQYLMETYKIGLSSNATRHMLSNAKYIGIENYCEGIISQDVFQKVQDILKVRALRVVGNSPSKGETYIFSGMLFCTNCGMRMLGRTYKNDVQYYCAGHSKYGNSRCDHKKHIKQDRLEAWLLSQLAEETDPCKVKVEAKDKDIPQVDVAAIKRKLEKLKDLYLNDLIDKDMYARDYQTLTEKLEEAQKPRERKKFNADEISSVLKVYKKMNFVSKKAFWGRIIDKIEVGKANELRVFWTYTN